MVKADRSGSVGQSVQRNLERRAEASATALRFNSAVVEIDEIFHHCSKAFLRSALWKPETWDTGAVASRALIAKALKGELVK